MRQKTIIECANKFRPTKWNNRNNRDFVLKLAAVNNRTNHRTTETK